MNIVIVEGTLSRRPTTRDLPSGDRLAAFEVTVRTPDQPTDSVPVSWLNPPERALRLDEGATVLVVGRVRRRFFRTAVGTGSRTEVVATQLLPVSQRKRVQTVLDDVVAAVIDRAA